MKKWKIVGVVFLAVLMVVCIGVDAWFIYIKKHGAVKTSSKTFEVGLQTISSGETRYFMEVNYYSNENNNGLEMFEVKYNYMLDENQDQFYAQGYQFIAKDGHEIVFDYSSLTEAVVSKPYGHWPYLRRYWDYKGAFCVFNDCEEMYNYASGDNFEHVQLSTNPIGGNSSFKIQLGDKLYLMKFRANDYELYSTTESGYQWAGYTDMNYIRRDYVKFDDGYLLHLLFPSVKSITPGTNDARVFEFGDLFNYSVYDEARNVYVEITSEETEKVKQDLKSYFSIKVNVSADGAQKASDSLFNAIKGSTTYNAVGDYSTDDYFYGRTIVKCDMFDYDFVNVYDNFYAIKLKQSFVDYYSNYNVCLSVHVDVDLLHSLGMEFAGGYTSDGGFENFNILEFYTTRTIDGQVVRCEVDYA